MPLKRKAVRSHTSHPFQADWMSGFLITEKDSDLSAAGGQIVPKWR